MSDELFRSGPWTGFYNYRPGDRHRMDLQLTFSQGSINGDGNDDIGRFLIRGRYDATSHECYWTKSYVGAHDVFYRGFREGKGIWGTWEIKVFGHGGFHIWPRGESEREGQTEKGEQTEPVDAIATEQVGQREPILVGPKELGVQPMASPALFWGHKPKLQLQTAAWSTPQGEFR